MIKLNFSQMISFFVLAVSANAATFYYNQVGYDASMPKTAIIKSSSQLSGAKFELLSGETSVFSGILDKGSNPDNWTQDGNFFVADFSSFKTPGTYLLQVSENGAPQVSKDFKIEENSLAKNTLSTVLDFFYKSRAKSTQDVSISVFGSENVKKDVHGGWYDASGDASKYLSHLSYANYLNPQQIPLTVWALAFASEKMPTVLSQNPSSATAIDEAVFGADFLVRMLDEQGFFYMTVFDGWGRPFEPRELCAFVGSDGVKSKDYQAAFREGGGMAIAGLARVASLKKNGDFSSEEYLNAAKKGYEHLQIKQSINGSCAYCDDGKENIIDDYCALLASVELYATTNEESYLNDARKRAEHLQSRISEDGYFWSDDDKKRPFWHASDAGLPLIALVRYMETEPLYENIKNTKDVVKKHLDWLLSITNKVDNPFGYARQTYKTNESIKDGFFIPHDNESKYWWQGEDARIASLSAASLYAFRILNIENNGDVDKYAANQLDWILGKNPYGVCMMHGKGISNPKMYPGQARDETLAGGIANGITGKNNDGSGIAWDSDGVSYVGFPSDETWNNWRWIEQWLPHSTWYLMALASRYDEVTKGIEEPKKEDPVVKPGESINNSNINDLKFDVFVSGKTITLNLDYSEKNVYKVKVVSLDGRTVLKQNLKSSKTVMAMPENEMGVFILQVSGLKSKTIIIR